MFICSAVEAVTRDSEVQPFLHKMRYSGIQKFIKCVHENNFKTGNRLNSPCYFIFKPILNTKTH